MTKVTVEMDLDLHESKIDQIIGWCDNLNIPYDETGWLWEYSDNTATEWGGDFYFADPKLATEFALRWA
jgi:hypothetical protein